MTEIPEHILKRAQNAREKMPIASAYWDPNTPLPTAHPSGTVIYPQTPSVSMDVLKGRLTAQEAKVVALNAAAIMYANRKSYNIKDIIFAAKEFEKYLLE